MKGIYLLCFYNLMVMEAVTAANSRFTFLLKGYPREQANCLSLASKLGEKFQQATGVQVDLVNCTAESKDSFDVQIEYFLDNPVPAVSTWPHATGVYPIGRFTNRKECEDRLAVESLEFQRQIGLFPTFAYCFNSARSDVPFDRKERSWGPKIIAFGKSAIRYRLGVFQLFALPKDPKSMQLRAKLGQALETKHAKFVDLVVQSNGSYADIVVHYYSEKEVLFNMFEDIRSKSYDECEVQRADIEAMFMASPNPPVVSFCGAPLVASSWEHDVLFLNGMPYRKLETFEKFSTFSECRANLQALKTSHAIELKKEIKGGACSYSIDNNLYRALLFL